MCRIWEPYLQKDLLISFSLSREFQQPVVVKYCGLSYLGTLMDIDGDFLIQNPTNKIG
jgi:hypothetical protein